MSYERAATVHPTDARSAAEWARHNLALRRRLGELAAVTQLVPVMATREVREHVAAVRTYLHDDVLRHATAEEIALFPVFAELGSGGAVMTGALAVEHDTVRDAAASLDEMARQPMTSRNVDALVGVLEGIELLLDGHLVHEAEASDRLFPSARSARC